MVSAENFYFAPFSFEGEGAGNVLVDIEEARAAQQVSASGPEGSRGRVGEGGSVEIRGVGVVSAQNLDCRIDLRCRLPLAAGIHRAVGPDSEWQAAKPAEGAADLESADDLGNHAVV